MMYYAIGDKRVVQILEEAERILSKVGAAVFRCARYEPAASGRRATRSRPRGATGR